MADVTFNVSFATNERTSTVTAEEGGGTGMCEPAGYYQSLSGYEIRPSKICTPK